MTYSELAAFDATDEQAKGLAIQRQQDTDHPTATDGEYAVLVLSGILSDYAQRHVVAKQHDKLVDAFSKASDKERADVAAALKIDLSAEAVAAELSDPIAKERA